jgi:tRNA pseudouridine32 synthase / 23S rRNA pseudouridine746 synthase
MDTQGKIIINKTVRAGDPLQACDFLALHSGLPKARIKDAMNKGAAWVQRKGRGRERLRRATSVLKKGDIVELFYDQAILSMHVPQASCLMDLKYYSIWDKPAGLLTQGTEYGDHCSLLRQAELSFLPRRGVYPVHRLDREVRGLVLVAHTSVAAGKLSKLFLGRAILKRYHTEVLGLLEPSQGTIDTPLDKKPALTRYSVLSYDPDANISTLLVEIETGRLHQIRRHLASIGHPVMGDPRYGKGNKDGKPMRLVAGALKFQCPFTGKEIVCRIGDGEPDRQYE